MLHIDIDNLAKFILDALNTVAYEDDKQVSVLKSAKLYAEKDSVVVKVKKLTAEDILLL